MFNQSDIDALRHQPIGEQKLLINGEWVAGGAEPMAVISPIDGKNIAYIMIATEQDVDKAVAMARDCFVKKSWAGMRPSARKKILLKIADLIEKHALELAVLGVRDNGIEIGMAYRAEPLSAAATFRYYAETIDKIYGEIAPTDSNFLGMILREPIGVVGAIIPWNFPLMIAAWKIAAALSVGNSVVLKPSEVASLALLRLGEICLEAGLPEGALHIVTGDGRITGAAMAKHMDIDVMAFTGSGKTARSLMEASAQSNLKRLYLELGGKSPNIIFADAENLDEVAKVSAGGVFRNSGEVCVAGSRLLVERSILEKFTEAMMKAAQSFKIGDPLDMKNDIGAITSEQQLKSDLAFVDSAITEGGTLLSGGKQLHQESGGYYMEPTIIGNVTETMNVFQNEVFGPVVSITVFDDESEAIQLANNTVYGLAGGVWTSNLSRAHRMVSAMQMGVVHVNTYGGPDVTVPLAGMKQSGNGADKSLHALDKYTNLKTAWIKL